MPRTSARSAMSPMTTSTPAGRRAGAPPERSSRTTTSRPASAAMRAKWLPTKPVPPVTRRALASGVCGSAGVARVARVGGDRAGEEDAADVPGRARVIVDDRGGEPRPAPRAGERDDRSAEPTARESGAPDLGVCGGELDERVDRRDRDREVVALRGVRFGEQAAEGGEVTALERLDGGEHARILGDDVARAAAKRLGQSGGARQVGELDVAQRVD